MTTRRWVLVGVTALALLLLAGRAFAGAYADYLWYDALNAASLWRARMVASSVLHIGAWLLAAMFAFANLYTVRQSVVSLVLQRQLGNLEIGEEVPGRYLMVVAVALSLGLGLVLALQQGNWVGFLMARSASSAPFGETDPYTGADLGFFVSWLPFEAELWRWVFGCVLVVSATVVVMYALTPSLRWQRGVLHASTYVRRHLVVLLGVLLLMLAWSFRLDMFGLLVDGSGVDGAFSYVDHRIGVPGNLILAFVTLAAAIVVVWAGLVGQFRIAGVAVLGVVCLALLVRGVSPVVLDHVGSDAERMERERPYAQTQAGYTRRAFGLDAIDTTTALVLTPSPPLLPWVPVWDPPASARNVTGADPSVTSASAPTAVPGVGPPFIAWEVTPRGVVSALLVPPAIEADPATPWGVVRLLAGAVDDHGAPVRVDAEGRPSVDEATVGSPLTFPGAGGAIVVADTLSHIAGTLLDSWVLRLACAWSLQKLQILAGSLPRPRPTVVAYRDVHERVERLAPFFTQSRRVDPVLQGDTLYWTVNLYATSNTYPLSRHLVVFDAPQSYVHHAAVAVVQASTGDVVLVADSVLDPIASSWVRQFPRLFGNWSALPAGLRARIPAREEGLYAQAAAFGWYGLKAGSESTRRIPDVDGSDAALAGESIPFASAAPGANPSVDLPRLMFALPMLDDSDRLRGLLIGVGGALSTTVWYPVHGVSPRWTVVLDRLQTADAGQSGARGSSARGDRGGPMVHGPVRAVPIRGGVAFVQPSYRWRPAAPEIERVAILVGDSLQSLVPGSEQLSGMSGLEGLAPPGSAAQSASIRALYLAMRDALRRGDWVAFGRAFDALGRLTAARKQ